MFVAAIVAFGIASAVRRTVPAECLDGRVLLALLLPRSLGRTRKD
jgi:hypothetical protein